MKANKILWNWLNHSVYILSTRISRKACEQYTSHIYIYSYLLLLCTFIIDTTVTMNGVCVGIVVAELSIEQVVASPYGARLGRGKENKKWKVKPRIQRGRTVKKLNPLGGRLLPKEGVAIFECLFQSPFSIW